MRSQDVSELTRISSKGQVVTPSRVRQKLDIETGSVFAILTPEGATWLFSRRSTTNPSKPICEFSEKERAWREIEHGQARRASRKRFLEELETWWSPAVES
jgi:AbrB family looped-hinge helix DNA binding protein